jgi:hypothetical protein
MANSPGIRSTLAFVDKAAQCPNCFSFNSPDYLPEKKQKQHASGFELTCVTCGTSYLMPPAPKAA